VPRTSGTSNKGDAKRIYERVDMAIVRNELVNQSEKITEKVTRWLSVFV
jgi:hypothetical protein